MCNMEHDVDKQYTGEMMKHMYDQSKKKQSTDFVIRAGNASVSCHRAVISGKSEYFKSLCTSGQNEVVLDYVAEDHGQILEAIVRFMYLGYIDIKSYNVESLLRASHLIKHHELRRSCENFMVDNLGLENFVHYQSLAKKFSLSHLSSACIRLTKDKGSAVLKTDWFTSLSLDELTKYLESDDLNVRSEDEVMLALQRWLRCTRASNSLKEGYVDTLLPCVRLNYCSKELLDELSNDDQAFIYLRFKLLEHLQHGRHGDHRARLSYATTGKTPSAAPKPSASAIPKPSASSSSASSPSASLSSASPATSGKLNPMNQVLLLGGCKANDEIHRNILFLDSDTDSVLTQCQLPAECAYFSACPTDDGLIVSGGYDRSTKRSLSKVKIFSLTTREWSDLPDLSQPKYIHGSVYWNNRFFTVGGRYEENRDVKRRYADVEVMDLSTNQRTTFLPLPVAVDDPGVARVHNNLLVIGGDTGKGWLCNTYSYNITTGERKTCQRMPATARWSYYCSTAVVNSQVYPLSSMGLLQYDVRADIWITLTEPAKPSFLPAMVLHENRLLVLGGFDAKYLCPNSRIQTFDLSTRKWSVEKRTMPVALRGHWALGVKIPTTE